MLSNFHTHTTYCDGKSTAEEVIISAINKGFDAIGFSGHGFTDHDLSYCMKDTDAYLNEINALKIKYFDKLEIYAGVEEDASCYVDRGRFDYVLGSSHYVKKDGVYYPIDCGADGFRTCLKVFDGNYYSFVEAYYSNFCDYIKSRRPDIVGHFDLVTKYDESLELGYLKDRKYNSIAERYISSVADSGCIFEVNTGAISRGYRTSPYPSQNLLYVLKKNDADVMLNSDCHNAEALDCAFDEARLMLKEIGFKSLMTISCGKFVRYQI